MRAVSVRAETADQELRSVEVVIATENPVERYDYSRSTVIREVLSMDGVEFRTSKRQLPIVDSHDSSSVRNVLGSVRNLRTVGDELIGDAVFASDAESQNAFDKLRDGHLTDFSITATPNEIKFIPRGESVVVRGQTIAGPAEIVTRWRPTDASLVATGADERSTVRDLLRRSYDLATAKEGGGNMSPEFIEKLKAIGLPDEITEEAQIQQWIIDGVGSTEAETPVAEPQQEPQAEPELVAVGADSGEAIDRALKADRARQREIRALCTRAQVERALADKLCDEGASLDVARKLVIDQMTQKQEAVGNPPNVTGSGIERLHESMRDGLIQRAITASGCRKYDPFATKPASAGAADFRHMGLLRMAEHSLQSGGVDTRRMTSNDIAAVAMGHAPTINRLGIRRDGEAYHVTGSFANLLQDAANKTLLAGYEESPFTWSMWARQAGSVSDFKDIKRNRFSEAPNLSVVPENKDYPEGVMSDAKETYSIEKYGQIFSVTWETIVNDDLDAISRIPSMHGNAARRTQNAKVYEVLTANRAMADTGLLFNATAQTTAGGHANYTSSGTVISVASLNVAFTSMMTKKGLNSSVNIKVMPVYLIVPAAIAATAMQVLGSMADPSAGGSAAGNSNTHNIYGPGGSRSLTLIVDPELDANSVQSWYLAASPSQIDTVELAFLAGEETPTLETEWDFTKDVYRYKIRQTFGVAPIDFRGLYKNVGA